MSREGNLKRRYIDILKVALLFFFMIEGEKKEKEKERKK